MLKRFRPFAIMFIYCSVDSGFTEIVSVNHFSSSGISSHGAICLASDYRIKEFSDPSSSGLAQCSPSQIVLPRISSNLKKETLSWIKSGFQSEKCEKVFCTIAWDAIMERESVSPVCARKSPFYLVSVPRASSIGSHFCSSNRISGVLRRYRFRIEFH